MDAKELALKIANAALEKQALTIEIIDVGTKVDYASYIVICSGRSERQVEAIAVSVESTLKALRVYPIGVEGREANQWVLMDYDDVVVHIFEDRKRGFYDLDTLWIDAERVPLRRASGAN